MVNDLDANFMQNIIIITSSLPSVLLRRMKADSRYLRGLLHPTRGQIMHLYCTHFTLSAFQDFFKF
jgi:hypothetical protein